jgi:hypothetical protein
MRVLSNDGNIAIVGSGWTDADERLIFQRNKDDEMFTRIVDDRVYVGIETEAEFLHRLPVGSIMYDTSTEIAERVN